MTFFTLFTVLLLLTSAIPRAKPSPASTRPQTLETYDPVITSPTARVIWHIQSNQSITWMTSNIPKAARNATGLILLGHLANGSEHLNIDHPLAKGFPLGAGIVNITVPKVPVRDDYIIALFGDSGNISPKFTITGPRTI